MGDLRSVHGAGRLLDGGWFRPAWVLRAAVVGLLVSFLLVLTACAGDEPGAGEPEVPFRRGEVVQLYGGLDGPDSLTFARIAGIVPLGDDRLLIADTGAEALRIYTLDGVFVRSVGRRGEGPGEFRSPCCPGLDPSGRVWIRDTGNARYQRFTPSGDSLALSEMRRMVHGAAGLWARTTAPGADLLVDVGAGAREDGGREQRRHHLDGEGAVVRIEAIPEPPPEATGTHAIGSPEGSTFYFHQPFGPRFLVDHGPRGGWAAALSSAYDVRWLLPDGEEVQVRDASVRGPLLGEGERERARAALVRDAASAGLAPGAFPYGVPDRKPPLEGLLLSRDGRLWVLLTPPEGAPERTADLWSPDGTRVARVSWPAAVQAGLSGWADGWSLYGIHRDAFGVERAARVAFRER